MLRLASGPTPLSTRVIDLFCPLGYGQRALTVAPPHRGKTTLLEHMARAVRTTHPAVQLTLLVIGERPEEVTHLRRVVEATSVVDARFDEPAARYTSAVELAVQRAMRSSSRRWARYSHRGLDQARRPHASRTVTRRYGLGQPSSANVACVACCPWCCRAQLP